MISFISKFDPSVVDFISQIATIIGAIGALISVIIAVLTYFDNKKQRSYLGSEQQTSSQYLGDRKEIAINSQKLKKIMSLAEDYNRRTTRYGWCKNVLFWSTFILLPTAFNKQFPYLFLLSYLSWLMTIEMLKNENNNFSNSIVRQKLDQSEKTLLAEFLEDYTFNNDQAEANVRLIIYTIKLLVFNCLPNWKKTLLVCFRSIVNFCRLVGYSEDRWDCGSCLTREFAPDTQVRDFQIKK